MFKKIALVILSVFLVMTVVNGIASYRASKKTHYLFHWGDTKLLIPKKHLSEWNNLASRWKGKGLDETDKSPQLILEINLEDLGFKIPHDNTLKTEISGFLTKQSLFEKKHKVGADGYYFWYKTKYYEHPAVWWDKEANFYRFYRDNINGFMWSYFKFKPESGLFLQQSWVASCVGDNQKSTPARLSTARCDTLVFYKNLSLKITVTGNNLQLLDEIKSRALEKLKSWDVSDRA